MRRVIAALLSLLVASSMAEAAGPQKRILVLSPFSQGEPSIVAFERAVHAALAEALGADLDYNTEHMANFFPDVEYRLAVREFLRRKYASRPLDVIIAIGRPALEFLRDDGPDLFTNAGIVAVVSADYGGEMLEAWSGAQPATGIVDALDIKGTLDLILRLQPATRQVVFVVGEPERAARLQARLGRELAGYRERLAISYAGGLPVDTFLPESALDAHTAVVLVQPLQEAERNIRVTGRALPELIATSRFPIYGVRAEQLQMGIVGGSVTVQELRANAMAELVLRVLRGERAQDVPVRHTNAGVPMVNWRQLRRWGISESRIPPGTIVQNRELSAWQLYRGYIAGGASVLAAQSLLIGWLLTERRRRRRAEIEVRQRLQEARTQLVTIAHLDRRAVVGEVTAALTHELNQPLGAILRNAEAGELMLQTGAIAVEDIREIFADIRKSDIRAVEIIRRLRGLLRRKELEALPVDVNELARETVALVTSVASSHGLRIELDLASDLPTIVGDRIHLQQVLLNLLLNAMEAMDETPPDRRQLAVRTAKADHHVEISVSDRGQGIRCERVSRIFEPFYTTKGDGMGIGLSIGRTIVEAHGGRIEARNNARDGATIWFTLPFDGAAGGARPPIPR